MWQALRDELLQPNGIELVTIGMENQGAAVCRPYIEAAEPKHPSLIDEHHVIGDDNCAIHHRPATVAADAAATIKTTKARLADVLRGDLDIGDFLAADDVTVDNEAPVRALLSALDVFSGLFGVVEP